MPRPFALARVHDSAARADSFITSPSEPVSVSAPLPVMRDASMKRPSPPAGVQARARAPHHLHPAGSRHGERRLVALCPAPGRLATQGDDLPLHVADSRFAGVAA